MRFSSQNDFTQDLSYNLLSIGIQMYLVSSDYFFLVWFQKWGSVVFVSGFKFIVGEATTTTATTTTATTRTLYLTYRG